MIKSDSFAIFDWWYSEYLECFDSVEGCVMGILIVLTVLIGRLKFMIFCTILDKTADYLT